MIESAARLALVIGPAEELFWRVAKVVAEADRRYGASDGAVETVAEASPDVLDGCELLVVLGGDGTMLRTLGRFLGTGIPVAGVNFGAVGFLTSIPRDRLEDGLRRVFRGEYEVLDLPTLAAATQRVARRRQQAMMEAMNRSGEAIRRRDQKSGWSRTGNLRLPSRLINPCSPATWSKCPWLSTIAWNVSGEMPSRSRFSTRPNGLTPASYRTRCIRPPWYTSTSAE